MNTYDIVGLVDAEIVGIVGKPLTIVLVDELDTTTGWNAVIINQELVDLVPQLRECALSVFPCAEKYAPLTLSFQKSDDAHRTAAWYLASSSGSSTEPWW